ncbi:MAG: cytochrome c oxidase subunit II [Hirschia sp.]|nr:cytochrome c oxidase subunit II [Hirschia sp.]MBF17066.1 cytochrome c oxidase subunit II [Hirschia sp.]|tara:strand:+ start:810 stop:1721 length:912 start_codon:yes stop_codon:yes gene_type:complete
MRFQGRKIGATLLGALMFGAGLAHANIPIDGQFGMQPAASERAQTITDFHTYLLVIITVITLFVTALLVWVIFRYNSRSNATPARFSHNTVLEVAWTTLPVMILIAIAVFSFPLLYASDVEPTSEKVASGESRELTADDWVTIKTYGHQWYWRYIYDTDSEEPVEFESRLIPEDDLANNPGSVRQLSVYQPMVVPQGKYVRLNIAAYDVIHSWAMPAFRVKVDAVPGRLNQLWFKAEQEGIYFGQCSELCGLDHAYMPIELRIVPQDVYDQWLTLLREDETEAFEYLEQAQPRTSLQQLASVQ